MTRVIVDESLRNRLHNLTQPVELCDESGRVLGRVFPSMEFYSYGPLEPQVSEEELDRRERANEKHYSTAEVLARLEKL